LNKTNEVRSDEKFDVYNLYKKFNQWNNQLKKKILKNQFWDVDVEMG
jgi:hypothetical protein